MSKKLSGAQRRKLAREEEATTEALLKKVPKLTSYFAPSSSSAVISESEPVAVNVSTPNEVEVLPDSESTDEIINENEADKRISNYSPDTSKTVDIINSDPSSWPEFINKSERDELLLKGPLPLNADNDYPKNSQNRHFSNTYQFRCAENGEKVKRKWLVYSEGSNSVYCFCCRLFEPNSTSQLGQKSGFNDWKHLAERLRLHETSPEHFKYMTTWLEAELRLKKNMLMDQIRRETERWQEVFNRLVAITLYLAEHNIAFRGSSSKLFTKNNGNYLGLIELIGQFDGVMSDHLRRVTSSSSQSQVTLLGNNIQNELICLLGSEIKQAIITKITKSKYFSVILDSTPDISHKDQISLTIRYVTEEDGTSGDIAVEESFIGYKVAKESTGEALSELLFEEIKNCHLNMNDCRGQAYDNGANMAGKNKGVQARVLKEYPRASYTPCTCHSLNLVVSDGAKFSVKSTSLFGIIQRIYTIFAGSTKRYCIISDHVQSLSIKQVCETRWEARISSIQAIRYQYAEVREALIELSDSIDDPTTASEAQSLVKQMEDFSFLTCLILWHDLLFQVNLVSKTLQGNMVDLTSAKQLLDNCHAFLASFRENGLVGAVTTAKEIAEDIEIESIFPTNKRFRKKKKQFSYEGSDEVEVSGTPEELFKRDVFLPLVDSVTTSLMERTKQLNKHHSLWGFLYDMGKLPEKDELKKCCLNLQEFLTFENISDINGKDLYNEIIHVKSIVYDYDEDKTNKILSPIKVLLVLQFQDQKDLFTNLWIALRIMLTIPLTVASAERSFSKLKLIKNYLRSTMTQERLTALAIISIENDVARKLDFKDILTSFAKSKARKNLFGV